MTEELAKAYESKDVESRWYAAWEKAGAFECHPDSKAEPFTLVLPPPNVTGQLHIGHAFSFTLQDVIVRFERMRGRDVLWLPGLDHAGIATQLVVERQLAAVGKKKEDIGREAFEAKVWEWKEESGGRIFEQLRVMGFSLDWSRQRFTLDPGLSRGVREAFVSLYEAGLIYRGTYIVNWCPRCGTALSDLEVETKPEAGSLWYIRYPGEDEQGIVVATTRPETLLGDTGVAVNPEDERYAGIVGKTVTLPLLSRKIPVLADSMVDPAFGTGAVKITPAHDPNDFQAGERLGLPSIVVMDERGVMNENAGPYAGKDRFEARKLVLADLQAQGLLVKTVPHEVPLGHCQRCDTIVEPRLSLQWFLKMQPLAEPAIAAVKDGRIRFVPEEWAKTYFGWMRNIRDWCVSRQLWWGHRIPAWTCACGELVVSREDPTSCPKCGGALTQVSDVLDTWFSSGLFPFSTLGWPEKTPELRRYYPNSVMMTGFDIIFFWVARMIFFGLRFMGEAPFPVVFINGLVRDENRAKMSKLKGNTVDPLELVSQHGADAVRLTLTALATPGNDPSLSLARLLGYKAFVNKLWNASRFALMNLEGEIAPSYDFKTLPLPSRWILTRLQEVTEATRAAIGEYRHDQATHELYHFVWDEFCAWYVEIAKVLIGEEKEAARGRRVLLEVLDATLRLLHPFIPFVTEEIWQRLPLERKTSFLMLAAYPESVGAKIDQKAKEEMGRLMALVSGIRTIRSTYEVAPKRTIDVTVVAPRSEDRDFLRSQAGLVTALARTRELKIVESEVEAPRTIKQPVGEIELRIPMTELFDLAAEKTRLSKERLKLEGERDGLRKKFENPNFVERARPEIVEEARTRLGEIEARVAKIALMLKELGG